MGLNGSLFGYLTICFCAQWLVPEAHAGRREASGYSTSYGDVVPWQPAPALRGWSVWWYRQTNIHITLDSECMFVCLSSEYCMHITHDKSWVHLKDNLKVVGYEVEMLEYHDFKGQFHKAEYSEEGGRVERWDLILKTKDRKKDRNRKEDSTDWHFLWMQLHLLQSYKGWRLPNQSFRVNLNSQLALNVWTWCIFERLHLMKKL